MQYIKYLLLTLGAALLIGGCAGNNPQSNSVNNTQEINGPMHAFYGAKAFDVAMFSKRQMIYYYDKRDAKWIGIEFMPGGSMLFRDRNGIRKKATYKISDGKMLVRENGKNSTISLVDAGANDWHVTGVENNGKKWDGIWYPELKFTPELLVGKCYISKYNNHGTRVTEKVCFTDKKLEIYQMDGKLKSAYPYFLKRNEIVVHGESGNFKLHLMYIKNRKEFGVWYTPQTGDYANNSLWTPFH
jgi:hypothetical protein